MQYKPLLDFGSTELLSRSPTEEMPSVEESSAVEMILDTERSPDVEGTTGEKWMESSPIVGLVTK